MSEDTAITVTKPDGTVQVIDQDSSKLDQVELELEEVKSNLMSLADVGRTAIDKLIVLADQSQHPKVYEALATLIKSVNESNREAGTILREKRDLIAQRNQGQPADTNVTNNNLYLTTSDAINLLKQKRGIQEDN